MTDPAKPAQRPNITQHIIDVLGRRIVSGEMGREEHVLFEQELIEEFGASRNAVREAVKTLAGKNLVVSARKKGTTVRPPEEWNLLDPQVIDWLIQDTATNEALIQSLSELRRIIEPEAAALAATRASATQILRLFECCEKMGAKGGTAAQAVHWDTEYHKVLLAASGNPLLRSLATAIERLLLSNFSLFTHANEGFIRNIPDHVWIAEAIRDRNPDLARQRVCTLLDKNASDIDELKQTMPAVDLPSLRAE
ncbi:FadR/GntR family transcriptional regulator [Pseudoruegeria sp. SHC-113]|uniref:FadR/GntR family transcriptional regulator n=1 Tax=Pseudoruegeria sp. SHC-113 TaxID=2855439 RepID=UPI0021BB5ED9|nr:FCD domain-containing protein [Pseudoruegeria sp. SHC-113]MCT8162103.1 FCD domain-containing protein [Pseudoruegeria sp. SHC-113]